MSRLVGNPLLRPVVLVGCAALFVAPLAIAQSTAATVSTAPIATAQASAAQPSTAPLATVEPGWSSSIQADGQASSQPSQALLAAGSAPAFPGAAALPSAPAPAAQDQGGTYSGWHGRDIAHRLTIEAGGGASAPAGDKTYITWGEGFLLGAGVNVNRHLATFIEYQFLDNKMPGSIIAEAGAQGGHFHIWSFTLDPVLDLFPKSSNDVYAVGGGGFYRKLTEFTDPTLTTGCFYYYCVPVQVNAVVGKISSNQGGWNIGGGYEHRFGGMYGLSRTRFFAEVRYLDVLSPAVVQQDTANTNPVNIAAGTKLLPITIGFRW